MKIRVITVNMHFLAKKCVYLGLGIGNGLQNTQFHLYYIPVWPYIVYIINLYYVSIYIYYLIDVFYTSLFTTQIAYKLKQNIGILSISIFLILSQHYVSIYISIRRRVYHILSYCRCAKNQRVRYYYE